MWLIGATLAGADPSTVAGANADANADALADADSSTVAGANPGADCT